MSDDSKTAFVTLQENNAYATVDIKSGKVTAITPFGFKDHRLAANALDAAALPNFFNASNNNNTKDDRSDDKGPEPEDVELGEIDGRTYAFIGLERVGGVIVYDITVPTSPVFIQYVNNRDFTQPPNSAGAKSIARICLPRSRSIVSFRTMNGRPS